MLKFLQPVKLLAWVLIYCMHFTNHGKQLKFSFRRKKILLSIIIGGDKKVKLLPEITQLSKLGWKIYTTTGILKAKALAPEQYKKLLSIKHRKWGNENKVDLIVNCPRRDQHISDDNVSDANTKSDCKDLWCSNSRHEFMTLKN